MGTYTLEAVIEYWRTGRVSAEQAIGQMLQFLLEQQKRLNALEDRLREVEKAKERRSEWANGRMSEWARVSPGAALVVSGDADGVVPHITGMRPPESTLLRVRLPLASYSKDSRYQPRSFQFRV
jgi:hypothetical protein